MDYWKKELKHAFTAPEPIKKQVFLRQLVLPKMPVHEFLFSQIGYIRKWVWCVFAIIFIVSILGFAFLPDNVLWLISSLTPLLALIIVSESGRSEVYKMAELEMTTRFSLRNVIFARLTILGLMDLLILFVFLIGLWNNTSTPLSAFLYVVTPFLFTSFTGLYITRKYRGQEGMYICVGISIGISVFLFLSNYMMPFIYEEQYLAAWLITALILLFGNGKQYLTIIRQTEEFAWNLS